MNPTAILRQIRIGQPQPFARSQVSAMDRQPAHGTVEVLADTLAGDSVGDTRFHGGADKAVHCYPLAHYDYWRALYPDNPRFQAGGFGENLCIDGADETNVCMGDIWQIGTARFQVSQGRQPCWKLNERFGIADMALQVQQSLRCGWYLRVLETGRIQAGDPIFLLERPFPDWPLTRILQIIDSRNCDEHTIREALRLPLPSSWQRLFEQRLLTGTCEDWQRRLFGQ